MSADNTLVILHHRGKYRVYDVNYSGISCHDSWKFPLTREDSQILTKHIVESPYVREIHKCNTTEEAKKFCQQFMKKNVVEYGVTNLTNFK